jgi:hypothetical protein
MKIFLDIEKQAFSGDSWPLQHQKRTPSPIGPTNYLYFASHFG